MGKIRNLHLNNAAVFGGTVLLSCILCSSTVLAEDAYSNLSAHRETAQNTGSICGVLFLGYVDGGVGNLASDSAYLEYLLDISGCADEYTFLWSIPAERIVETDGGNELYCIYPCDENASVTVNEYIVNEDNDYLGESGEILYCSESGEPILLRCNVSEVVSDCQVTITDSEGETLVWEPALNLSDGTVSVPWHYPFIYDGTYDAVDDYGKDMYGEEDWEEEPYDDGQIINLSGTVYTMQVINCNEWISLREYPDVNSQRLARIPLGEYVYECRWYSDDFVYGCYNGQYGYMLTEYLTLIDAVVDYVDDDWEAYEEDWDPYGESRDPYGDDWEFYEEDGEPHGYFNYAPLPYDSLVENGAVFLNYTVGNYTVVAGRMYDTGEVLFVNCYVNGTEPLWGYVTGSDHITELCATEAFIAGTELEPRVAVYNSTSGFYMIDMITGEIVWQKECEDLELSGSICHGVDENGTMYIAGFYDTDILAMDADGAILWRANPENSDIYWPYEISIWDEEIVVSYESGNEYGHYVVSYGLNGQPEWMDIW